MKTIAVRLGVLVAGLAIGAYFCRNDIKNFLAPKVGTAVQSTAPAASAAPSPQNPAPSQPPPPAEPFKPGPVNSLGKGRVNVVSAVQGWGTLQYDKNIVGGAFNIGGKTFARGLGTHANSAIVLKLASGFNTFSGSCGIDVSGGTHPRAIFKIIVDGKVLYHSPLMKGNALPDSFSIPVQNVDSIELDVEGKSEGDDPLSGVHADWVDLQLN